VCFAGMAGGERAALVMIRHEGIDRPKVQDVLCARRPAVIVTSLGHEEPTVAMSATDVAERGRCRRGIWPLRIVVMPQHEQQVASPVVEPMPVPV
jgi:hypothetical protein